MSKENSYCVKKEVNVNTKCENSGRNVLRQDYHTVAEYQIYPWPTGSDHLLCLTEHFP